MKIKFVFNFFKFLISKIIAYFYKPFLKEKIFLFCERGFDAQDNAFIMYEYFVKKGYKCKYLITKKSKDFSKINIKDYIEYDSFKHFFYLNLACCVISTHAHNFLGTHASKLNKFYNIKAKFIFLQHGIIKDDLPALYYKNFKCDLFVTSCFTEYSYVLNNFGYKDKGVLRCTGMPRFDFLENTAKDPYKILIMPTFRKYLNASNFKESLYYKKICSLLSNKKLIEFCKMNNILILFYPHIEIHPHLSNFFGLENEVVKIVKYGEFSVQNLLKECHFLITDYSSVAFDFAYMQKPIAYYQFDKEDFLEYHYGKGYFDYEKMGFGPVFEDEQKLINYFIDAFNRKSFLFVDRSVNFFNVRDNKNRERILNLVKIILGETL